MMTNDDDNDDDDNNIGKTRGSGMIYHNNIIIAAFVFRIYNNMYNERYAKSTWTIYYYCTPEGRTFIIFF